MLDLLLITNSQRESLMGVAKLVAQQQKANLFIVTEKNIDAIKPLKLEYTEPVLLIKKNDNKIKIEGQNEIIKYLRTI